MIFEILALPARLPGDGIPQASCQPPCLARAPPEGPPGAPDRWWSGVQVVFVDGAHTQRTTRGPHNELRARWAGTGFCDIHFAETLVFPASRLVPGVPPGCPIHRY